MDMLSVADDSSFINIDDTAGGVFTVKNIAVMDFIEDVSLYM